jgi:hypothetical protein
MSDEGNEKTVDEKTIKQGSEFRIKLAMKTEKEQKKEFLEQYALAKLLEKAEALGVDPKGKEPSQLVEEVREREKEVQEKARAPSGQSQTENVYSVGQQTGKPQTDLKKYEDLPLDLIEFQNEQEMISVLKTIANSETDLRRNEARKRLRQFNARVTGQNAEYELEGKISEFLRNKKAPKPEMKKIEKESGD